jgi:hypothetical protein
MRRPNGPDELHSGAVRAGFSHVAIVKKANEELGARLACNAIGADGSKLPG